jgi:DNA segregation ATPase FtsK/SpoIIIE, S-DNA-T family
MQYLTQPNEIRAAITTWKTAKILWLDTEIADWQTPNPILSLIQVLANPHDRTGKDAYVLDVLDKTDLIRQFIQEIMVNPAIEKVFHNASFDLRYLGQTQTQNITCTLKLARKIGKVRLNTSNLKLKTLATELCQFTDVDASEQSSDWGRRRLSATQLHYAAMDVAYLAALHLQLQAFGSSNPTAIPAKPASNNVSLSPTKIRTAFECPRLFYLGHHQGLKTLFVPPDSISGVGKPFHTMADRLVTYLRQDTGVAALFEPKSNALDQGAIALTIQQQFYKETFFPYLQTIQQKSPSQALAIPLIWAGLRSLITAFVDLLVRNRPFYPNHLLLNRTFPDFDRKLEKTFTLPNGSQQKVAGEYDCLVYNAAAQRFCVLEFKTYAPIDPTAQLAQVAIYSDLLQSRHQMPIDAGVYSVLPEFQSFNYGWDQLDRTVRQLIPHKLQQMQHWLTWKPGQENPPPKTAQPDHLCPICPQKNKCQAADFGSAEADMPPEVVPVVPPPEVVPVVLTRTPPSPAVMAEADRQAQRLVETFSAFGVETTYEGSAVGPAFIRVKLKPQIGTKVIAMTKLNDDLRVQLGLSAPPMIAPQAGFVSVDLPRADRQTAHFQDYIQAQDDRLDTPMKIAIGVDLDGQLCEADLSDPNTCHFLVGGTTGSGKSEFLKAMLLSLLSRHSPKQLQILLVDPKRVTFPEFEQMPWLLAPVVKETEVAIDRMQGLVEAMESRYRRFENHQCSDIAGYNRKFKAEPERQIPRVVCIFDEYADFMAEKESAQVLEQSIKRLGAMARAAGIHLIIATQRPEARVVTPLIRSNLPGRVALRTASAADSAIILGGKEGDAANLLGKGDLLYQNGGQQLRLQSLFVQDVEGWLKRSP